MQWSFFSSCSTSQQLFKQLITTFFLKLLSGCQKPHSLSSYVTDCFSNFYGYILFYLISKCWNTLKVSSGFSSLPYSQNLSEYISVQFSHSVMSDSLQPHESQHARPPCPSPTSGVHSDSCPSSQWCHPVISSSVIPFSSCPQSLPASESFPMNQLFAWGGQSIGVSALASVLPMNTQDWSPLEWTGWISLQSKGLSRVFSNTTVQKQQFFGAQFSSQSSSHIHTRLMEKP